MTCFTHTQRKNHKIVKIHIWDRNEEDKPDFIEVKSNQINETINQSINNNKTKWQFVPPKKSLYNHIYIRFKFSGFCFPKKKKTKTK